MPTPIEVLEKEIHRREAALSACEAETAAREAELQELKESLQKLQATRSGIRGAIDDALSDSLVKPIEPTDLLEMAVEGNESKPFENGNLTAVEAVRLALISLRNELGSKKLVQAIIRSAVHTSRLDAEGVIKAALETVRGSSLSVEDVMMASMQAARNCRNINAFEIIRPAVEVSMELGIETHLIIKEMFVAGVRRDPDTVKSSLLSVLGCAMGLGMTYRDIKDLMKAFSKEVKHGALGRRPADDPSKNVRFFTPPEPQDVNVSEPQQPQTPQPHNDPPGHGDTIDASVVQAMVTGALDSINKGGPGLSSLGDTFTMLYQWPEEYAAAQKVLHDAAATPGPSKRSAGDETADQAEVRPSKKVKTHREGRRDSDQ